MRVPSRSAFGEQRTSHFKRAMLFMTQSGPLLHPFKCQGCPNVLPRSRGFNWSRFDRQVCPIDLEVANLIAPIHSGRQAVSSFSDRATRYSCPGGAAAAAFTPAVGPIASRVLVDFAGFGFVSVSTPLLTKRSCTGLGVRSTTAALGLPD
jgi:hypothetical protein